MRTALISLAAQPRGGMGGAPLAIAGQTLARRQLGFALATGCTRIVALGEGASQEATELGHAAEAAGAAFHRIATMRGLVGSARAGDDVLVLAPGLLPEAAEAREWLSGPPAILVLPGGVGAAAGFERIDRDRAWAGALVMPGALIERLAELPPEGEAAPALLRIALQGGVKDRAADEAWLADGSWAMISEGQAAEVERARLARVLPPAPRFAPTERAASNLLRAIHARAVARPRLPATLVASGVALLIGGPLLAWLGYGPAGFLLIALAAGLGAFRKVLRNLRAAPWGDPVTGEAQDRTARWLVDFALALCAGLTIEGDALHRIFPPLVLVAALRATRLASALGVSAWLSDRAIIALTLAVASAAGWGEAAVMAFGLAIVALDAVHQPRQNG